MTFELFVVQHSHIDIGYTERQERIADYQAQKNATSLDGLVGVPVDQRSREAAP